MERSERGDQAFQTDAAPGNLYRSPRPTRTQSPRRFLEMRDYVLNMTLTEENLFFVYRGAE
jgi:hypothetical protein